MRNYLVYIKVDLRAQERIQSYVTPCFSVDKLFWEEQECRRLFIIGSSPSLALAFAIREQINGRLRGTAITEKTVTELRRMAVSYVKETNRLYGKQHEEQHQVGASMTFHLNAEPDVQGDADKIDMVELNREAERLYELIVGRALFIDEIERIMERSGKPLLEESHQLEPSPHHESSRQPEIALQIDAPLQLLALQERAQLLPGIRLHVRKDVIFHRLAFVCERCGGSDRQVILGACHTCEQSCAYCTACLEMGRSKCCTLYVYAAMPNKSVRQENTGKRQLQWNGEFSPAQSIAAQRAQQFVEVGNEQGKFLIWAVCGAGKTELIFPAIDEALVQGGRVLVATPRKDVVLELAPRLAKAFPNIKVIAVHGSSLEKWEEAQLVISTTHQVMRYYRRFALVIVDEVDAFPYRGDPILYRAVQRSKTEGGKQLYLSATPPAELTRQLVRRRFFRIIPSSISHVLLPLRYHGHPLPVPEVLLERRLEQKLRTGLRMNRLLEMVAETLKQERQLFLFVPRIEWIELVLRYLERHAPAYAGVTTGVHAADPERVQKVASFRMKQIRLIVTTTILERGVTIPRSDVIVLGADAGVFDEAALVQIAGRVGRSADAPTGSVRFILAESARSPYAAVKQIKRMNQLGLALRKELERHAR